MEGDFNLISRTLESSYVFYDRLQEDYPSLHGAVSTRMDEAVAEAQRVATISDDIRRQADKEREKENVLIQTFYGTKIAPRLDNSKEVVNFIDLFNDCLNLKDVYERNKSLIMNSEGQKGVFSYFGTYLEHVLDEDWQRAAASFDYSSTSSLEKSVQAWLEKKIPEAIEEMFNAKVENSMIDPELQNAYKELLPLIGQVSQHGSYSQELAKIYGLDEIKEEIVRALNISKKNVVKEIKTIKANMHSRGGLALEALDDLIAGAIGADGHKIVGSLGAKADNIMTFGFDMTHVAEYLDGISNGVSRKRNIDLFSSLERHLQGLHSGFIVYTSDKNYTLNSGFRSRGGYSAGEDLTARSFKEIMDMAGKNMDTFIGAILQFNKKAVGDGKNKEVFEQVIAKNIAYLLFDDFTAVGAGLSNGVNTLHVMNLNGILLPISTILYALADSIDKVIELSPTSIVSVHISTPTILFPTPADQSKWVADNGGNNIAAWEYQRQYSLDNTKISTHFLASLQTLLRNTMLR